jgi:hypothetical protein
MKAKRVYKALTATAIASLTLFSLTATPAIARHSSRHDPRHPHQPHPHLIAQYHHQMNREHRNMWGWHHNSQYNRMYDYR